MPNVRVMFDLRPQIIWIVFKTCVEFRHRSIVAGLGNTSVESLLERLVVRRLLLWTRRQDLLTGPDGIRVASLECFKCVPVCVMECL